jgi:hypothetical protein
LVKIYQVKFSLEIVNLIKLLQLSLVWCIDWCTLSQCCCFLLDPSYRTKHCKRNTYGFLFENTIILINIL